jgi:hypothetical protein
MKQWSRNTKNSILTTSEFRVRHFGVSINPRWKRETYTLNCSGLCVRVTLLTALLFSLSLYLVPFVAGGFRFLNEPPQSL